MKNFSGASLRSAFLRLFEDEKARNGECMLVEVKRNDAGCFVFGEKIKAADCSRAIHSAGEMSSSVAGVLVVAHFEDSPLILARYGDTPPDLM